MLRYRIARDPRGHYFVLPALVGVVRLEDTYSSRAAARQTADWCNSVHRRERHRSGSHNPMAGGNPAEAACVILPAKDAGVR